MSGVAVAGQEGSHRQDVGVDVGMTSRSRLDKKGAIDWVFVSMLGESATCGRILEGRGVMARHGRHEHWQDHEEAMDAMLMS